MKAPRAFYIMGDWKRNRLVKNGRTCCGVTVYMHDGYHLGRHQAEENGCTLTSRPGFDTYIDLLARFPSLSKKKKF